MARQIAKELAAKSVKSLIEDGPSVIDKSREPSPAGYERFVPKDSDEGRTLLAPIFNEKERMSAGTLDDSGLTRYAGRVCAVFSGREGALVDINCEAPARWYPERVGSAPPLILGSEVDICCCQRTGEEIHVISEQPPRFVGRGGGPRIQLSDLQPGDGPFRAVVISCTIAGTLVDFNCEVPGRLTSSRSHSHGDELRVFCYEADVNRRSCAVGTVVQPMWLKPPQVELKELSTFVGTARRGVVQRVVGGCALVDVNCEVLGVLSAFDVDFDIWPDGISAGYQVIVYIVAFNLEKQKLQLSMFSPRFDGPSDLMGTTGAHIASPARRVAVQLPEREPPRAESAGDGEKALDRGPPVKRSGGR